MFLCYFVNRYSQKLNLKHQNLYGSINDVNYKSYETNKSYSYTYHGAINKINLHL